MSSDERSPERSERLVQYEFKVIVRVSENAWPEELRAWIGERIDHANIWTSGANQELVRVQSVERVHDGY